MMTVHVLDTMGQKCPKPVLKLTARTPDMQPGDIMEVLGDYPAFEKDMRTWCRRLGKIFLSVKSEKRQKKTIQIQF